MINYTIQFNFIIKAINMLNLNEMKNVCKNSFKQRRFRHRSNTNFDTQIDLTENNRLTSQDNRKNSNVCRGMRKCSGGGKARGFKRLNENLSN